MPENEPSLPNKTMPGDVPPRLLPKRRNRNRLLKLIPGFVLVALLAVACGTPTLPCGTFTFTGTPHNQQGITNQVDFNFNPATCGATCTCNTICYVQIVRIINRDDGSYLQPFAEQANRMVTGDADATQNGWAVDRLFGRVWGYYGRNNDATFNGNLTTGSNTATATLRDRPSGWPNNSWFDAVSVPVCIDSGASCNNRLLGYEYWLFIVDTSGNTGAPFNEIGVTWMQSAFNKAVVEWNNDAPGLGKNSFPGMSPLP
ncbi:MAG TPA: hypothetical protein VHE60_09610 [Pyrinomonadaceae bacterium]|nr:hypothetical protein [Pyrinomonadaceae bacterium]